MSHFSIDVSNVGGIDQLSYSFDGEVLLVAGPNATNKTSFLEAFSFGLGHSNPPIKSDADRAHVSLSLNGRTAERTAERTSRGIRLDGDGLLVDETDAEMLENFVSLLEFNPLRTAVRQNESFEDILKAPIDVDALEREQRRKIERKRELQQRLDTLSELEPQLDECQESLTERRGRAADIEARLADLREEYTEPNEDDNELESLRETRASMVSDRNRYEGQISDLEDSIERLNERRQEAEDTLETVERQAEEVDVEGLKRQRENLREELEQYESRLDILRSVYTANQEMMASEFSGVLGQDTGLLGDSLACWACGNTADRSSFDETLDDLQSLIKQDQKQKREYEPRLEELSEQITDARENEREIRELRASVQEFEQEIETRRQSLETKREQISEVEEQIEEYSERIDQLESKSSSEASELAEELEEVRLELYTVENEIERLEEREASLREQLDERESVETEIETLGEEISELTEQIEGLEERLRSAFNESMDDLLQALSFDRIEKVWLTGDYDLVIAREVDGRIQRDSIENLSESEREMIGLVLALGGFLTYNVAETIPALVLDTLGAFDAMRTERLLDYFADKTEILVAAVLPEVAEELPYPIMEPQIRTGA